MTTRVSDCCGTHRKNFPSRAPNLTRLRDRDEKLQIGPNEGLFEFVFPPVDAIILGRPPSSDSDVRKCDRSKYLWVVASATLPAALEYPTNAITLKRGSLTHTNLTGSADAHTGGELWFPDSDTVMINGGSSRYGPRNADELLSVAVAFRSAGYKVASLGWDEGSNKPLRMETGNLTWV